MSALETKILSYNPEVYMPMDFAINSTALEPYNEGSVDLSGLSFRKTGAYPVFDPTGGPDGQGAWKFSLNLNSEMALREYTSADNALTLLMKDFDFTAGIWFKIDPIAAGDYENSMQIFRVGSGPGDQTYSPGSIDLSLWGSDSFGGTGSIMLSNYAFPGTYYRTSQKYDDGQWHFFAARMTFDGTTITTEAYLDGQLTVSGATSNTASATFRWDFGDNFIYSGDVLDHYSELSKAFLAPSSVIGPTEILEIYNAGVNTGPPPDISYTATPMTASASKPEAVVKSSLADYIEAYSPFVYFKFDEPFTTNPTHYGSYSYTGTPFTSTGEPIVYEIDSPAGSGGSWKLTEPPNSVASRLQNDKDVFDNPVFSTNGDYAWGFWFKINELPEVSYSRLLLAAYNATSSYSGFTVFIYGSLAGENSGKLRFQFWDDNYTVYGPAVVPGEWNFLMLRANSSSNISGTTNNADLWLNGSKIGEGTTSVAQVDGFFRFGDVYNDATTMSWNISDFFVLQDAESIDAAGIQEIWQAGGVVNATYNAEPTTASAIIADPQISQSTNFLQTVATATATIVESTIVSTVGDNVYVTTIINVEATFPQSINVVTNQNLFLDVLVADASADIVNNLTVTTNEGHDHSALPMTANASLQEQVGLPRSPMTATAELIEPQSFVTPNYKNIVLQKNPYLYISNGELLDSNIANYGYQDGFFSLDAGATFESELYTITDPEQIKNPMAAISEPGAWGTETSNNANTGLNFEAPSPEESIQNIVKSKSWSYELWVYHNSDLPYSTPTTSSTAGDQRQIIGGKSEGTNTNFLTLNRGYYFTGEYLNPSSQTVPLYDAGIRVQVRTKFDGANQFVKFYRAPVNTWNHYVITCEPRVNAPEGEDQGLIYLWVNGNLLGSSIVSFDWPESFVHDTKEGLFGGFGPLVDSQFDEVAFYDRTLTNAEILQANNFVRNFLPDSESIAQPALANVEMPDAAFLTTENKNIFAFVAEAGGEIVSPTLIAGTSVTNIVQTANATATIVDPTIQFGITYDATEMLAYAESNNAFALNTIYFDYVQSAIAPYRYISFDCCTPLNDWGSDNDYSVPATQFNGEIVNPDRGINGKSAKTLGLNYATDALVMMESEFDDDWNTGIDEYHSAFWFKQAEDDVSTGLRVLWNLNGAFDNQHVILYHYQNKLHLSFNNGSGTFINQATTSDVNLFDGQEHFILIDFDHTGSNNFVILYVDAERVMEVDLGTYTGQTINSDTYLPPNDPASNFPRLGFGGLITPFADTALPVVPANYKSYIDEPYWAITTIVDDDVTALYSVMPSKANSVVLHESYEVTADNTDVQVSAESVISAEPMIANALVAEPEILVVRIVSFDALAMTADSEMADVIASVNINIVSDIFIASASLGSTEVVFSVSFPTMNAYADLYADPGEGIFVTVNGYTSTWQYQHTPWARWLRATGQNGIGTMKEVK